MTKKTVAMIGAGRLGAAIGGMLSRCGNEVAYWDVDPTRVTDGRSHEDIVAGADIVFLCVPSQAVRAAARDVRTHLRDGALVVTCSKGIEVRSGKFMNEVLDEELGDAPHALLCGPMLAAELADDEGGAGVAAAKDAEAYEVLCDAFSGSRLVIEGSSDPSSVAMCSVLKNVYAIAMGMVIGCDAGENIRGWLAAKAVGEMRRVVEALGGDPEVALGPAGIGDLVATGFSERSSNHTYGLELVRTGTCDVRSEGCVSFPVLAGLLGDRRAELPLFMTLHAVIMDGTPARDAITAFIDAETCARS